MTYGAVRVKFGLGGRSGDVAVEGVWVGTEAERALKDVRDTRGVPLSTARRCDASGVQRVSDFPERTRASPLGLADDWKHIDSVAIRFGPHGIHSALAGYVAPWVT